MKKAKSDNYLIDQSGKVEFTSKPTIVALANGKTLTVKISAVEKRKLIEAMKALDFPKQNYIYKIFACLIFILLKSHSIQRIIIDKEYPGHESVIKDILIYLSAKHISKLPEIGFGLVGKKCQAHINALSVYQKEKKPTLTVKARDVLELLYQNTKKGRRSHS